MGWDVMMKMVGKVKTFDTGFGERRDTEVESKWQNVIFFGLSKKVLRKWFVFMYLLGEWCHVGMIKFSIDYREREF